ncbi:N-acyl homoserine lactonase family protein [Actinoplanes rectilineatus]|uniref:N-acyl homoserine lactonase family protein n=1 Tax=Actinoplanes rectilineatus TaxID=113571 RepID=UPI0005F28E21|nr:N-acyl homoserine lactonase family protein [Actinoplanes rectilineatus]
MIDIAVRRVGFGYFVRPGEETPSGVARVEPALGYLVEHADGLVLVDTGMGSDPGVDAHYQPRRIGVGEALKTMGYGLGDVSYVVNCHLHFDHCGGNPEFPGTPVFVQRAELELARHTEFHTLPELVDYAGARYEVLDGDAEILPGVLIVPTPGHTAGHQSVVVRSGDGTVIVAGQGHDHATAFTGDVLGRHAGVGEQPDWLGRLLELDPRRVLFAHDNAVWTP